MADLFIGTWNIVQQNNIDDSGITEYLSELNGQAARIPHNIGGRFVWKITQPDNSLFYALALISIMPDPTPPPVLTLGKGVRGMQEMYILVEPPKPEYIDQLWMLTPVPNEVPDTLKAHILPSKVPILSAATAKGVPNPEQYVYAIPEQWPDEERVWTFKRA